MEDFIPNNPFYKSISDSLEAMWILTNEKRAKGKIRSRLRNSGLYSDGDIEEIYSYCLYYFIEHNERLAYDPDYFGDETRGSYPIDAYVLNRVGYLTLAYSHQLVTRDKMLAIHNSSNDDYSSQYTPGTIDESFLSYILSAEGQALPPIDTVDLHLDAEIALDALGSSESEALWVKTTQNFLGISLRVIVEVLILSDLETPEEIAKVLRISESKAKLMTTLLKGFVKNLKDLADDENLGILSNLKTCILAKARGWTPNRLLIDDDLRIIYQRKPNRQSKKIAV